MHDRASAPPSPSPTSSNEVATLVAFLASDESSYCTGSEFTVDGGLTAGLNLVPEA